MWSVLDWGTNVFSSLIWHIRLERTQNLLYESTKDFLKLKFDARSQEKSWVVEKDRLLRELESHHKGKRKAAPASTPLGRSQTLSRSTSVLPPDPQLESQYARREELKVQKMLLLSGSWGGGVGGGFLSKIHVYFICKWSSTVRNPDLFSVRNTIILKPSLFIFQQMETNKKIQFNDSWC